MNLVEFEDLLDRFGENVSQWPLKERVAATALLARSAKARALLYEAAALRKSLSQPSVRAPAGLAERIVLQAAPRNDAALVPADKPPEPRIAAAKPSPVQKVLRGVEHMYVRTVGNTGGRRLAFLSVCFAVGLTFGVLQSMDRLDVNEGRFTNFLASVIDAQHVPD